jgi:spore germination cell wall hydrolase CwlJ-like protein
MLAESLLCLTLAVFHEARSEPEEAQVAVAQVALNRSRDKDFPSSVCAVVYSPKAFSWTSNKKKRNLKESGITNEQEKRAYIKAKRIASLVLSGKIHSSIGNRLFFSTRQQYHTPYKPIKLGKMVYY